MNPLPDKYVFIHYFQSLEIIQFLFLETSGAKFYFHFGSLVVLPNDFGQGGLWSSALLCGSFISYVDHLSLLLTDIDPNEIYLS